MKTQFQKSDLVDALTTIQPALTQKPSMPILRGVLITTNGDRATISATDQSTTITTHTRCETTEDGQVLIPGRLLASIASKLPNKPITLTVDGAIIQVTCGRNRFDLPTMTLDDYPPLPNTPATAGEISGHEFTTAVKMVATAAGRDDTLPMLTGIRVDATNGALTLVATDRFRLAHTTIPWNGPDLGVLIPARALTDVCKLVGSQPLTLRTDERRIGFTFGDTTMIMRLIDADYPKWRPLIPKTSTTTVQVGCRALIDAVKRVSTIAGTIPQVRIHFEDGQATVTTHGDDTGSGSEIIDCELSGEPITMGFTSSYLTDAVAGFTDDRVLVTMTDPRRPAMMWPDLPCEDGAVPDAECGHLLMPIRLPG